MNYGYYLKRKCITLLKMLSTYNCNDLAVHDEDSRKNFYYYKFKCFHLFGVNRQVFLKQFINKILKTPFLYIVIKYSKIDYIDK